jgi:hypothetical protein
MNTGKILISMVEMKALLDRKTRPIGTFYQ